MVQLEYSLVIWFNHDFERVENLDFPPSESPEQSTEHCDIERASKLSEASQRDYKELLPLLFGFPDCRDTLVRCSEMFRIGRG